MAHICSGDSVEELYNYYEEFSEEYENCLLSSEDSQDATLYCVLKLLKYEALLSRKGFLFCFDICKFLGLKN